METSWKKEIRLCRDQQGIKQKKEGFMRSADNLEKIESQIMSLPVSEQIHLIERIARRVRSVQTKSGITLNWNKKGDRFIY